jgi:hypothetical protein
MVIVSVEAGLREDGKVGYHAMVVVQADPDAGLVSYSDPQNPNMLYNSNMYRVGGIKINLPVPRPTQNTGMVQDILRVRLLRN